MKGDGCYDKKRLHTRYVDSYIYSNCLKKGTF